MTTVLSPSGMLPHSQRLRLIRSIRKLGDLLTESSHPVEAPPPLPQHSRSNSLSSPTLSPGSYSTSAAETLSEPGPTPASAHPRNFFSLRLPKSSSPLSPTFNLSLDSPSTPVIDPETLKERKLAKVSQTLGQNVPPELVLQPPAPRRENNRSSTVSVPEYTTAQKHAATAAGAAVARRRRHARDASRTIKHAASSASLHATVHNRELEPFSCSSLVSVPSSELRVAENPIATETSEWAAGMRRKEAGWSGEWSVLDLAETWRQCNYVFRDGQVNPDRNSIQDFQSFFNFSDAVLYNSIAATLQNKSSSVYSQNVVKFIETWFLDADTAMNPNLNYAQVNGGPSGQTGVYTGILDLRGFAKIASGILILRETGNADWTSGIDNKSIAWCAKYINWLETAPTAHNAATAGQCVHHCGALSLALTANVLPQ
ncbi:alginate lyase-domain-containing protein [Mycena alexandri]|uniref:Alginate lyase-domain-containing protein n=1 Tax=Mycena alexandri TaxID=1745969 RepID=A0AAD6X568_9AGAR|nr:alginate lyase-domain-containing protein [Mycena alexandri]